VFGIARTSELPNVPTIGDIGGKPFEANTTAGVFVRGDTPRPLIDKLNEGVVAGLKDEAVDKRLREIGATVRPSTPEQFAEALKADEANVAELLKLGLLKPE